MLYLGTDARSIVANKGKNILTGFTCKHCPRSAVYSTYEHMCVCVCMCASLHAR